MSSRTKSERRWNQSSRWNGFLGWHALRIDTAQGLIQMVQKRSAEYLHIRRTTRIIDLRTALDGQRHVHQQQSQGGVFQVQAFETFSIGQLVWSRRGITGCTLHTRKELKSRLTLRR